MSILTPPFTTLESAQQKARMAENVWNTKNPEIVVKAYTPDSEWRNRSTFLKGHHQILQFLAAKWQRELGYKLIKEVWCFHENRIAVRFAYEWHNEKNQWFRSYGNENWEFAPGGLMQKRFASINDVAIEPDQRVLTWQGDIRPADFPSLSELNVDCV